MWVIIGTLGKKISSTLKDSSGWSNNKINRDRLTEKSDLILYIWEPYMHEKFKEKSKVRYIRHP